MSNSPSTFSFASPSASGVNNFSHRKGPSWPRPTLRFGSPQSGSSSGSSSGSMTTPQFQQPPSDGKKDGHQNNNTSNSPYQPFLTTERDGTGASINSYYNSITCMPDYGNLSLEDLRLQDYQKG